jgi:SNF2 family DNA or RNA helicase
VCVTRVCVCVCVETSGKKRVLAWSIITKSSRSIYPNSSIHLLDSPPKPNNNNQGLGKTIQTIGFVRCIAVEKLQLGRGAFLPFLVVCPLGVVDNWEREFRAWCPDLDVVVYKGGQRSRELIQRYEAGPLLSAAAAAAKPRKRQRRPQLREVPSILSDNVDLLGGGIGDEDATSATAGFSVDEELGEEEEEEEEGEDGGEEEAAAAAEEEAAAAGRKRKRCGNAGMAGVAAGAGGLDVKFHVLVTSFELASKDAYFLRKVAWEAVVVDEGHRLKSGATGKLYGTLTRELRIAHRVLLTGTPLQNNTQELWALLHFLDPVKFDDVEGFQADFAGVGGEAQLARLRELIAPHMLRRLKRDVNLSVPEKQELLVRVELSASQRRYYRLVLTRNFDLLRKTFRAASSVYNLIVQLKKVCNHALLMQGQEELAALEAAAWDPAARLKALLEGSGKLALLDRMLRRLKTQGHRVLIFSQMATMLNYLEDYLYLRGWRYLRLDGSTSSKDRQARIDAFNASAGKGDEEHFVFLLSTRAGGVGINLTTADTVVIYDVRACVCGSVCMCVHVCMYACACVLCCVHHHGDCPPPFFG